MQNLQTIGTDREIFDMARRYVENGGDPSWCFFHTLSPYEKEAIDRHLVQTRHPLAFEAGTRESRFMQLAKEWSA